MKKYLKPLLWICVILFVCVLLIPVFDAEEYVYSIDHDTYIYRDDVMVTLFEGQDTLEIDVDPSRRKENWRWLLEGSIKRFAYSDGVLIIEYHDKWYTFDVKNYEPENMYFDLKEYETVEELKEIYPDLESFKWKYVRYERTENGIIVNGGYREYKDTTLCYKDFVPEYENIGER